MYMNDMANLILILSCIHVHVGIYVILGLFVITCTFLLATGSGLRFIVRDSDNMTILTLYDKPNQNFGRKSVVVTSLCPRFALMNEIDLEICQHFVVCL